MPCELNLQAWRKLIDENIEWLLKQPRTLERDHIQSCLVWLRKNKPAPPPPPDERVAELEKEIEWAWHVLMNDYGGDPKSGFVDEDITIDQVTISDGIQSLGEVAYLWRQERDDLIEEVTRLKAAAVGKGGG